MRARRALILLGTVLALVLCLFCGGTFAPGYVRNSRAWAAPPPPAPPTKDVPLLNRRGERGFSYGEEIYDPLPHLSLPGTFGSLGTGTFAVAQSRETYALACFLLSGGQAVYRFPDGWLSGVHPGTEDGIFAPYEGVFCQDVNGDALEDLVVLTYGAVGNFPQLVNLATVYLQEEDGYSLSEDISLAALQERLGRSGQEEVVPYGTIFYTTLEDVCDYYENGCLE